MVAEAGEEAHSCLIELYNMMLDSGQFPEEWPETLFVFLPKGGNLDDPSNWRPIAVLRVCYKIFARIIYNRLKLTLDEQQSEEQMGFRAGRSTEDALLILEEVVSKSVEFRMPLWLGCLDLSKAFDRIEWHHLFQALKEQGITDKYCSLLAALYEGQVGSIAQLGHSTSIVE